MLPSPLSLTTTETATTTMNLALRLLLFLARAICATQWDDWWTYEGFSGPEFWGLVHTEWKMCARGLQQSPINVDPSLLLYDPNMGQLSVDKLGVNGVLQNTGQQLLIRFNQSASPLAPHYGLNLSGGPLGSYHYRLHHIAFHFPRAQERGSEHTIDGERFPAEVQLLGYNRDLYANFSEAMTKPAGLVGVSVMIDLINPTYSPDTSNVELKKITNAIRKIRFRGESTELKSLSIRSLLPETMHYVTYEGSLTYPGCYETVTWILLNKPIYLTNSHMKIWQNSLQKAAEGNAAAGLMGGNFRPLKDLNTRLLRTNINFKTKQGSSCPTMYKEMYYKANPWRQADARAQLQRDQPPSLPTSHDAFHAPLYSQPLSIH